MPRGGESFASGRDRVGRAALALLLLAMPIGARGDPLTAGMPLADALENLRRRGLHIVFSDQLVGPELLLAAEPASTEPRFVLEEILAPHGLTVREGEGASLSVISRSGPPPPAGLQGVVRSRTGGTPLSGVEVALSGPEAHTLVTDPQGRFGIERLPPGDWSLVAREPGFVVERRELRLPSASRVELALGLQPTPLAGDEIVVHPSRIALLDQPAGTPFSLDRDEILSLPHLGNDVFRAVGLMPGTTTNDVSARFAVRGGRRDQVLILLDGQELYDAFHLQDFDSALSVVPASRLARVDLSTGTFPSSYGDRLGGVLDMTSLTPFAPRLTRLSLSVLEAELSSSGSRADGDLQWVASLRRGNSDLADRVVGEEGPSYWDLFAKLDVRPRPETGWRLNVLHSRDRFDFFELIDDELTTLRTRYRTSAAWVAHQHVFSATAFVDTSLSTTRIDRDRRGEEDEEERALTLEDRREVEVLGALQSWYVQPTDRARLRFGVDLRRFEADLRYRGEREWFSPLADLVGPPPAEVDLAL